MTNAFQYVINNQGISSDAAYPYIGRVSDNFFMALWLKLPRKSIKTLLNSFSEVSASTTQSIGQLTAQGIASCQKVMSLP